MLTVLTWAAFIAAILAAAYVIARGVRRITSDDLITPLLRDDADTAYDTLPDLTDDHEDAAMRRAIAAEWLEDNVVLGSYSDAIYDDEERGR